MPSLGAERPSAERSASSTPDAGSTDRGVSPVVGVALMLVIVVSLVSVVSVGFGGVTDQVTDSVASDEAEELEAADVAGAQTSPLAPVTTSDTAAEAAGVTHTVRHEFAASDAVRTVVVTYEDDAAELGAVDDESFVRAGVDETGNDAIDRPVDAGDVDLTVDDTTVEVAFDDAVAVAEGENLVVAYADVENGAEGTHDVSTTVLDENDEVVVDDETTVTYDEPAPQGGEGEGESEESPSGLVTLSDTTENADDVTHTVWIEVADGSDADGNSLGDVDVHYEGGVDVSDVDQSDVVRAGIDETGDGEIDQDALADLSEADTDTGEAYFEFGGSVDIEPDDGDSVWVLIEFEAASNGDAGVYDADAGVNTGEDGPAEGEVTESGSYEIEES